MHRIRCRTLHDGDPHPAGAYVYRYVSLEDGGWTPIYVGKGRHGRGRSHLRVAIAHEDAWTFRADFKAELLRLHRLRVLRIEVVAEGLTEEEAFAVEEDQIARFGRLCEETGTLFNIAKGGKRGVTTFIALKAARTRKRREAARKAAFTRKRREAARKAVATRRAKAEATETAALAYAQSRHDAAVKAAATRRAKTAAAEAEAAAFRRVRLEAAQKAAATRRLRAAQTGAVSP